MVQTKMRCHSELVESLCTMVLTASCHVAVFTGLSLKSLAQKNNLLFLHQITMNRMVFPSVFELM
jgi:hypothetical protein